MPNIYNNEKTILNNFVFFVFYIFISSVNFYAQELNLSRSDSSFVTLTSDSLNIGQKKTSEALNFYSNSHLLFGAEIIDPADPTEFISRTKRVWKTDVRLGISKEITNDIAVNFSLRNNDSPQTNRVNLYEIDAEVKHSWGNFYFGQKRFSAGNGSFYLNEFFDRNYWDKGLIYDFIIRSVGGVFNYNSNQIEVFIGADQSSTAILGSNFLFKNRSGFKIKASALYLARDPIYAANGTQLGFEFVESNKNVTGYQVVAVKIFTQEPFPVKILTVFNEVRFHQSNNLEIGAASLIKSTWIASKVQNDFQGYLSIALKITPMIVPRLSAEFYKIHTFDELHFTISSKVNFYEGIYIIPIARYILTGFGEPQLFIGFVGGLCIGK